MKLIRLAIVLIFFLCSGKSIAQLPNPIAKYTMDGNVNDVSGNNLHGINNGAQLTTDRCGIANRAYSFNGVNSSIAINASSLFDIPINGQYSISVWVQPTNSSVNSVFVKCFFSNDPNLGVWDYGMYLINGQLMSGAGQTGHVLFSNSLIPIGQCWTHLVTTYNNGVWRIYVNGVMEGEDLTQTNLITTSNSGLAIGKKGESNGDFFAGKIDDIEFYNVELTPAQVQTIYDQEKVTISPINNNVSICPGDATQLDLISSCPNFQTSQISWTPSAGLNSSNIINPIASPLISTTYSANIVIDQCPFVATVNVNVGNPQVNLGNDITLCMTNTLMLDAGNSPLTSYVWQDGSINQTFNVTSTGTYSVTVEDANGCTATDAIDVTISSSPNVNIGVDVILCSGSLLLDALNIGASYSWQDGSTNQTFNVISNGTYWVDVNSNGCITRDSIDVSYSTSILNAGIDDVICIGELVTLQASGLGSVTYNWDNGIQDNIPFALNSTNQFTVSATDINGCAYSDMVTVNVNPLPVINAGQDIAVCENEIITLNGSGAGLNGTYVWGNNIQNNSPFSSFSGNFIVTGTDQNGCSMTDNINVSILNLPNVSILNNPIIECAPLTVELESQSQNTIIYEWKISDGTNVSGPNPTYESSNVGCYDVLLIGTSVDGCIDSVSIQNLICVDNSSCYEIEEELFYVPNAFTPDGDEFNQIFQPVFTSGFDPYDFKLLIFNRWGEIVFESNNASIGWDGTYSDSGIAKNDIYTWRIEFGSVNNDYRKVVVGSVLLLR